MNNTYFNRTHPVANLFNREIKSTLRVWFMKTKKKNVLGYFVYNLMTEFVKIYKRS